MANEVKLITGASGTRHITPQDDASLIRGIVGNGAYILNDVQLEIRSNNTIVIPACDLIINGRHIRITNPKSVTIENGVAGNSRTDTIYLHYTNTGGIEDVDIRVNKGAGVSGRVEDFGTSSVNQFTLATVTLNGINITGTRLNVIRFGKSRVLKQDKITLNQTWVAPQNGTIIRTGRAQSNRAYMFCNDKTLDAYVSMITIPYNQDYGTAIIEVIKGHTYTFNQSNWQIQNDLFIYEE